LGLVRVVPRTCEGGGRNDDSERNDATDNPMCVASVVTYVVAPICVRVALIGHDRLLGRLETINVTGRPKFHCGLREQTPTAIVVTSNPKLESNVMRKLSAVAFIIIMITARLPAIAYTQEDADACTPDAMRLCQNAIPDASRVALCLVQNKRQLSPACTVVFNRPRGASAARERRENIQKTNF
jgi:hypothetical protein